MPITYDTFVRSLQPDFSSGCRYGCFCGIGCVLMVGSIYLCTEYMKHEGRIRSFYLHAPNAISSLGSVCSGDLFTLLLSSS